MTIPKDNAQLKNARRLRREMTPHERKLWYLFLRKYPVKMYKQRIIGRFIVDFYCTSARLVIDRDFRNVCAQIDLIIRKRLQDPLSYLR